VAGLEDPDAGGGADRRIGECAGERVDGEVGVGRIGEDEVEGGAAEARGDGSERVGADDVGAILDAEGGEILADGGEGGATAIDEGRARRAATHRFDPECAGAGVEVEYVRAGQAGRVSVLEVGEERLANTTRRRSGGATAGGAQSSSSEFSRDDAHNDGGKRGVVRCHAPGEMTSRRIVAKESRRRKIEASLGCSGRNGCDNGGLGHSWPSLHFA
jgi:hypothetical protein